MQHTEMPRKMLEDRPSPESEPTKESIGNRYEDLMAEASMLRKELDNYPIREFDITLLEEWMDATQIGEMTNLWLGQVREQTAMLRLTDSLGIEIMKEDLEKQAAFGGTSIDFESKTLFRDRIQSLRQVGGRAFRHSNRVEIADPKPSLREQLRHFLSTGTLHPVVGILIHELIHNRHHQINDDTLRILTEAQAYWSGILEAGSTFSIGKTIRILTQPEHEGGLYEYDADLVIEAVCAMARLHGMGVPEDRIAKLVADSRINPATKKFSPLSDEVEKLAQRQGLDEVELQALDDLYRLELSNQRRKAQLALYRLLEKKFDRAQRREAKVGLLRRSLAYPDYYLHGNHIPSHELLQSAVVPANEKYPYELPGPRSAIIFGFFVPEGRKGDEHPIFGIGRLDTDKNNESHLELAQTPEQEEALLEDLKKHAPFMGLDQKQILVHQYVQLKIDAGIHLPLKILKALFSPEEREQSVKLLLEWLRPGIEEITIFIRSLKAHAEWTQQVDEVDPKFPNQVSEDLMDQTEGEAYREYRKFTEDLERFITDLLNSPINEGSQEFAPFSLMKLELMKLETLMPPSVR